jgi:AraC family transcriptional activator FtrA
MPHRVAALVFDGLAPFELGVVVEVFGLERPELDVDPYELVVCAPRAGALSAVGGFALHVEHGLDALAGADTVVVPAWPRLAEPVPPAVAAAVRGAHEAGARVVSICSGVFVLAAAGLLDGRRAAAHWRHAALLRGRHPGVDVDERVLYVDDGRVLTSAGSAAGIDLCLHLVRRDHGTAVANQVARRLVVPPHRDGDQAQFIERPVPAAGDDRLGRALAWGREHLPEASVAGLAARAFMSPRTFARHVRAATGASPQAWLVAERVRASVALLEGSDAPVEDVARAVGFASGASLRKAFGRELGVSPAAYRRTFSAPAGSPFPAGAAGVVASDRRAGSEGGAAAAAGASPLERPISMSGRRRSIGSGKTIVELGLEPTSSSVCR